MTNQIIWIGITIGVFFTGLAIGILPVELEKINVQRNMDLFDKMDFVAFNNQDWELVSQIHAPDVKVVFANGHETNTMDAHQPEIAQSFSHSPDLRITAHPIMFGQGEWTAGTGVVEGTFTEPMNLPDGTVIEPTGESYKYTMVTIAKWNDGVITEEYLFWDNAEIAKQMGLMSEPSTSKNLQIEKLIETFKEKYSKHGLKKDLGSNGIPYRYTATTNYNSHVELLLEKDRIILREIGTPDGDTICIVSNPIPRDILKTCPSLW